MGAGTYTGIEAESNGIPNLREPKTQTAQKTMVLMSVSLAIAAFGLIVSYYLFDLQFQPGKTLNAVLVGRVVMDRNPVPGKPFNLKIWGPGYIEQSQYLRVFIAQIRKKIEDDPNHPVIIITEPAIGYRFISEE